MAFLLVSYDPDDVAIGERLRAAIGDMPPAEVAVIADVSPNTFRRWLKGEVAADAKSLAKIAEHFDKSLTWLLAGRGDPDVTGPAASSDDDYVSLPMLGATLSAGPGNVATGSGGHQASWKFPRELVQALGGPRGLHLLRVTGDSMEPDLSANDWVIVNTNRREGDGIFAVNLDREELLIKRVQSEGRFVRLISSNEAYQPIVIDRRDEGRELDVLGKIVWSTRTHGAS